jgi:ribosomal protein L21
MIELESEVVGPIKEKILFFEKDDDIKTHTDLCSNSYTITCTVCTSKLNTLVNLSIRNKFFVLYRKSQGNRQDVIQSEIFEKIYRGEIR